MKVIDNTKVQTNRRPGKDELNQYIYDLGYDTAINMFKLTEKDAEHILIGKEEKRRGMNPNKSYLVDDEELPLPAIEDNLNRCIQKYYDKLYKYFVRFNDNKINTRSMNKEDVLHNTLLKVLEKTDRFEYVNDEDTLRFLMKTVKYRVVDEHRAASVRVMVEYEEKHTV